MYLYILIECLIFQENFRIHFFLFIFKYICRNCVESKHTCLLPSFFKSLIRACFSLSCFCFLLQQKIVLQVVCNCKILIAKSLNTIEFNLKVKIEWVIKFDKFDLQKLLKSSQHVLHRLFRQL